MTEANVTPVGAATRYAMYGAGPRAVNTGGLQSSVKLFRR